MYDPMFDAYHHDRFRRCIFTASAIMMALSLIQIFVH